jgi:hypothetical protein
MKMTAIHTSAAGAAPSIALRVPNVLATVANGWAAFRRRRFERASIVRISRMDPHLIRDMGFEPEAIYAALDGTWEELDPGRFTTRR